MPCGLLIGLCRICADQIVKIRDISLIIRRYEAKVADEIAQDY